MNDDMLAAASGLTGAVVAMFYLLFFLNFPVLIAGITAFLIGIGVCAMYYTFS